LRALCAAASPTSGLTRPCPPTWRHPNQQPQPAPLTYERDVNLVVRVQHMAKPAPQAPIAITESGSTVARVRGTPPPDRRQDVLARLSPIHPSARPSCTPVSAHEPWFA
jgi:hypothetical protein